MRNDSYFPVKLTRSARILNFLGANKAARVNQTQPNPYRVELEYLKAVNSVAPPKDPQLLFLLVGEYANANRLAEGVQFLSARLNEFGPRLPEPQRALYLSAIGLLRAQHASSVSVFRRIGYVKDTVVMLDQAKRLSDGQIFVVNWISGIVRAQLPGFLGQKQTARDELAWCVANAGKAPHLGCYAKHTSSWQSSLSPTATKPKPKLISVKAATKVSTSRSC